MRSFKTSHVIDLKFAQNLILKLENHTLEFSADVNFTNLLNKNWGKRYFTGFDQVQLLQQVGFLADGTTQHLDTTLLEIMLIKLMMLV
jgi:hypothetical protein